MSFHGKKKKKRDSQLRMRCNRLPRMKLARRTTKDGGEEYFRFYHAIISKRFILEFAQRDDKKLFSKIILGIKRR